MSEHKPVYNKREKWECSCGMINPYETYTCIKCGNTHSDYLYTSPCEECGICKKIAQGKTAIS